MENASSTNIAASIERHYTPLEKSWLQGKASNFTKEECGQTTPGLMYVSTLGNQCGCSIDGFRPRHSVWSNARDYEGYDTLSVRLVRNLARSNQTLCFMGDLIDFQFYAALRNNLERVRLLQATYGTHSQPGGLVDIETRSVETPVTYTNDTGFSYYTLSRFRKLTHILQTFVTIDGLTTSFKWIKLYGWSPMHTSFADDCTVVVGNPALHYDENTGELKNAINILLLNTLALDFRAFVGSPPPARGGGSSGARRCRSTSEPRKGTTLGGSIARPSNSPWVGSFRNITCFTSRNLPNFVTQTRRRWSVTGTSMFVRQIELCGDELLPRKARAS